MIESAYAEAMAEGGGELLQCNIVLHGHPGAGKSSVKCVIFGQPPRPKHKQSATDILEKSVRTVCVERVAVNNSNQHFEEVDNDGIISRLAGEVTKYMYQEKNETINQSSNIDNIPSLSTGESNAGVHEPKTNSNTSLSPEKLVVTPSEDHPGITKTEYAIKEKLLNSKLSLDSKSSSMFDSLWLHHIDSGGQPQFLDVLPLLYRSPSHFMMVMRLTEGLDERPKVWFHNKGNDVYCLPDHLVPMLSILHVRRCKLHRLTCSIESIYLCMCELLFHLLIELKDSLYYSIQQKHS